MKSVAVEGLTLQVTIPGGSGTAVVGSAVPSQKVKAGAKVYAKELPVTVQSGSGISGTCVSDTPYNGIIPVTSTKVRVEGEFPVREGDEATFTVPGKTPGGNPCTFQATVKVDNPGQTKVRCN